MQRFGSAITHIATHVVRPSCMRSAAVVLGSSALCVAGCSAATTTMFEGFWASRVGAGPRNRQVGCPCAWSCSLGRKQHREVNIRTMLARH